MRAAIYARYSSDNQRPESIDDQVSSCRSYAAKNNITVDPDYVYADEAVSGSKSDRVGLNALIAAAKDNKFEAVLVDDLSRFSRSMIHLMSAISQFDYLGIRLISVTDNIDTSSEDSKLGYQLRGIFNELALDDLKKKTLRGLLGQKQRGYFVAEACFGYRLVASGELKLDKKGRSRPDGYKIEINTEETIIVKRIFDEFASGKSLCSIVRVLNGEKIKGRYKTEKGWGESTVHRILKNEKYVGIWKWGIKQTKRNSLTGSTKQIIRSNGPLYESLHDDLAIISKEVWDIVQEKFREMNGVWPGGKGHKGYQGQQGSRVKVFPQELLSGAMVCGVCGGSIVKASGKGGGYYGCLKAKNGGCDNKLLVRKKLVEHKIISKVGDVLNNSENIQYLMRKIEELSAKMFTTVPEDIRIKQLALQESERAAGNYVKFVAQGNISKMIADALAASETKIKSLKTELHALEQTRKQVFKRPPPEWIEDRIVHIQVTLEKQTEQSALLLRKLLGTIKLEPVIPEIGKPYLRATSKLQPLVLFDEKRPRAGPLPLESEPDDGSNALQWWTQQKYARTIAELPFFTALLVTEAPPLYQIIAKKAKHLRELGLNDLTISKRLKVDNHTVTKALKWLDSLEPT